MADSIKIGNLDISAFKVGGADCSIYLGSVKLYPSEEPPSPTGSTCYEVISTPIASYTSTTYDSVYSFADTKWYMLNNLNEYEEYGIYEIGTSLSDFTYYPNKLVVIGETEYQYQTNGWAEVGEYIDVQTTYEVTDDSTALQGKELPTTFKIPYADVEALGGWLNFRIGTADGVMNISTDFYQYMGSTYYEGTVTNDGEYYYFSLPNEAPSSVIIQETNYYYSTPIHLIFGSRQASVGYTEKETPTAKVYNTVADMEAVGCPTVGISQYGVVGDNVYQFEESEEWVNKAKSSLKFVAKYNDNKANVVECNTSNELSNGETQPSHLSINAMIDVYIGDCVTSIGASAFDECSGLTSIEIPDSVTSIGGGAFYGCTSLTSVVIPDSVTSIGISAFIGTPWWNTYSADTSHRYGNIIYINDVAYAATSTSITSCAFREGTVSIGGGCCGNCSKLTSITIPNSVTTIGSSAFRYCTSLTSVTIGNGVTNIDYQAFAFSSKLTSITINAATPPTLGTNAFQNTNNCPIYVPSSSVDAFKSAWPQYASRIQAIPT